MLVGFIPSLGCRVGMCLLPLVCDGGIGQHGQHYETDQGEKGHQDCGCREIRGHPSKDNPHPENEGKKDYTRESFLLLCHSGRFLWFLKKGGVAMVGETSPPRSSHHYLLVVGECIVKVEIILNGGKVEIIGYLVAL